MVSSSGSLQLRLATAEEYLKEKKYTQEKHVADLEQVMISFIESEAFRRDSFYAEDPGAAPLTAEHIDKLFHRHKEQLMHIVP